jgi:AcrR family transcriptional regulator
VTEHTVVWARPERAAKGPAPSRSRAQIAAAAVALADAEGLEAVSMRRVAAELGIGAASLYRYVLRKDELYDLMVDLAEGEDGPPAPLTGDRRADLTAIAHRTRAVIHRHPWMATLAPGRPPYGPNSLVRAEHFLAALDGLGMDIDEMFTASEVLQAFVRGYVVG